ncbi:putative O-linked N-acetylglucosamine transferase (SPINDLY family) [Azospirillum agricola]|uniref:O-linked N-acetylglucosamine transferase, SPINDLY family protein n=1 Tax=Azospirillum agricola TaxID=1720247 RepID=UPI001F48728A|nr:tetratricopeptide repeat protein [Azospirillum agricola]MBP2233306.1 putative O-linked N-acetylglucosamine transferase (SPINDLY family) [Azospirillum agricola]
MEHHKAGRVAEAEAGYRAVLRLIPNHPHANNNLAMILRARHEHEEAIVCYRHAADQAPNDPHVHSNFGCLLMDLSRWEEAQARLRRAIELKPDYTEAHFNLGNVLRSLGDEDGALASYTEALRLNPDMAPALCNMGDVFKSRAELTKALNCFVTAQRSAPQMAEPYNNLGETLKEQGRIAEAVTVFQKGLAIHQAHAIMHSNLLLALNYTAEAPLDMIYRVHRHWAERHAEPHLPTGGHANDRDPGRKLRIGYVSPDFCAHSVSFFAEPAIREHDRTAFEVFCYPSSRRSDVVTARLRAMADHWIPIVGMSDEDAAARIKADRIDILVDLAGHTAENRLTLFARKPAPVQVTWLGYPNTTGMRAIDYRLTDGVADPVGAHDHLSAETLVRLPHGFHCYLPPVDVGAQPRPPVLENGFVTFGSFNNTSKVTPDVVRVWAEILKRVPSSHLLLKSRQMGDDETRKRYVTLFAAHGIAEDRLTLLARIPAADGHLRAYDRIDVGLDPFPYNGTTTTCEALWMGVPVLTLAGRGHVARVGASLLTNCGLGELIATDEADYIARAVALAGDPRRLVDLRSGMRNRLEAAPLTDYKGFTLDMERAFREMWRVWTNRPN